jgi:hypothetical protein
MSRLQSDIPTAMSTPGVTTEKVSFIASAEQLAWLNAIAKERGVSVSDILRRLIDETRGAYLTPRKVRRAANLTEAEKRA